MSSKQLSNVIQRCILMATDPGDLCTGSDLRFRDDRLCRRAVGPALDHGSIHPALHLRWRGRAHHGRALSLVSARGQPRGATQGGRDYAKRAPSEAPTGGDIRQGFVYERVPHITLKSIANNAEIDVIWERWQETLEPLRARLNAARGESMGGVGDPARGGRGLAGRCHDRARRLVGGAHLPTEGDRRFDRRQGRP